MPATPDNQGAGPRRHTSDDRVTFADAEGIDEAIEERAEDRDYLAEPERFARLGAHVPREILLSGPPGAGKSLLARAIAGEANAAFIATSASEFVEVFVGEGASRARQLFAEARPLAPAIVFIDELDSIGTTRGVGLDGTNEPKQTLNQLLIELDGFEAGAGVIAIAATNRPDMLDPALRLGRFDRKVTMSVPDRDGRVAILTLHARNKHLAADVGLDTVAGLTRVFSGADLAARSSRGCAYRTTPSTRASALEAKPVSPTWAAGSPWCPPTPPRSPCGPTREQAA